MAGPMPNLRRGSVWSSMSSKDRGLFEIAQHRASSLIAVILLLYGLPGNVADLVLDVRSQYLSCGSPHVFSVSFARDLRPSMIRAHRHQAEIIISKAGPILLYSLRQCLIPLYNHHLPSVESFERGQSIRRCI